MCLSRFGLLCDWLPLENTRNFSFFFISIGCFYTWFDKLLINTFVWWLFSFIWEQILHILSLQSVHWHILREIVHYMLEWEKSCHPMLTKVSPSVVCVYLYQYLTLRHLSRDLWHWRCFTTHSLDLYQFLPWRNMFLENTEPSKCVMWCDANEDTLHALFTCPQSIQVW